MCKEKSIYLFTAKFNDTTLFIFNSGGSKTIASKDSFHESSYNEVYNFVYVFVLGRDAYVFSLHLEC